MQTLAPTLETLSFKDGIPLTRLNLVARLDYAVYYNNYDHSDNKFCRFCMYLSFPKGILCKSIGEFTSELGFLHTPVETVDGDWILLD